MKPFTEHSTVLLYNSFWGLGLFEPLNGTMKYDSMSITSVNKRLEYVHRARALPAHSTVRSSFFDKRSHPPESACVRDILGRSYNKELQRFSLPSPQVSLLRAAHASRSRDTKKTELEDTREKNTYAKDTENIDIRCFIFFSSKRILVWIRLSYKYVFFILQII